MSDSGTRFLGVYPASCLSAALPRLLFARRTRDPRPRPLRHRGGGRPLPRARAAQAVAPAAADDELALTCPSASNRSRPTLTRSPPPAGTSTAASASSAGFQTARQPARCAASRSTGQLLAAADTSTALRRTGWTLREWRQMLEVRASLEAERAALVAVTARSDEQEAAIVYHSGASPVPWTCSGGKGLPAALQPVPRRAHVSRRGAPAGGEAARQPHRVRRQLCRGRGCAVPPRRC